jgi:hypothetical protein
MKGLIWLIPAVLIFCATSHAQETPGFEISGGYSYMRANLNGSTFNMSGGHATATQNLNDWFGGRVEVNFYQGTVAGRRVYAQTFTYGPVFSYRRSERLTPFAHAQFGDVHASQGYLGISTSAHKFAMTTGAGVDLKINSRAAIRLQGDYLMTRFLALRQDNLQGNVGLVIYFGTK